MVNALDLVFAEGCTLDAAAVADAVGGFSFDMFPLIEFHSFFHLITHPVGPYITGRAF